METHSFVGLRDNRPKLCGNHAFPQSFQAKKLGEISVF